MSRIADSRISIDDLVVPDLRPGERAIAPALPALLASEEQLVLWALLSTTGCNLAQHNPLRMLSLGSGSGRESTLILSHYAGLELGELPEAFILDNVDIDETSLDIGQRVHSIYSFDPEHGLVTTPLPGVRFVACDGRDFCAGVSEKYHVVYFGHQNSLGDRLVWRQLFESGSSVLAPNGLMIVTSLFDREHEYALAQFRDLGASVHFDLQNPCPRQVGASNPDMGQRPARYRRIAMLSFPQARVDK